MKDQNISWGIYTVRMHWGARQNKLETPKDRDEVNKQDIHECDGWAHDPDTMVAPKTQSDPERRGGGARVHSLLMSLLNQDINVVP